MAIDPALLRAGTVAGLTCASAPIEEIPAIAIPPRAAPVVLRKSLLLDMPTTPFRISIVESLKVLISVGAMILSSAGNSRARCKDSAGQAISTSQPEPQRGMVGRNGKSIHFCRSPDHRGPRQARFWLVGVGSRAITRSPDLSPCLRGGFCFFLKKTLYNPFTTA